MVDHGGIVQHARVRLLIVNGRLFVLAPILIASSSVVRSVTSSSLTIGIRVRLLFLLLSQIRFLLLDHS